uniref:UORF2 n=1 Tax=Rous sarcoma virus TaxID=11886 RepID=Q07625_9RETR|nr:unnamed protein product [Rous sarcoma virus]
MKQKASFGDPDVIVRE